MQEPLLSPCSSRGLASPSGTSSPNEQSFHDLAPSPLQSPPYIINEARSPSNANLSLKKRHITYRSRSAPSVLEVNVHEPSEPRPAQQSGWIVRLSLIAVIVYVVTGVAVYMTSGSFKGTTTAKLVDAIYFTMVTLCTTGYGDIIPDTTFTKIFTCIFILVGFGFVAYLLNWLVAYICDAQEAFLLSITNESPYKKILTTYMVDEKKGRMRIRTKFCVALAVVIGCIAIGTITVHFVEDLNWADSFYLSITSVTTVGYGDYSFKTVTGRSFAILWLLVSTLAFAKAFVYLADYSVHKRTREMAKWVLKKKITLSDFPAADLDNDGSISKSEFVIFKLKEMGKITEIDIQRISRHFDSLDYGMHGKITLVNLMDNANISSIRANQSVRLPLL
ncbi:two-pore potassium channel 3-like [Abrus precatorius]|uniref:Two-pore potassium channel 3-like n=1 Tax=Abrus precatorius TaxID=3816 RepID=A0A8B8MKY9_ABRPR|nr:two-pore potassium channel 3-like [Abrus precatorius]